jgi:hypothetical protein
MADDVFTLRRLPGSFRSALFVDDGEFLSTAALWELDPRRVGSSPPDFGFIPNPGHPRKRNSGSTGLNGFYGCQHVLAERNAHGPVKTLTESTR